VTDRSVVARLRAEASQFLATMGRAAKSTEQVGTSAEKASKQATGAFDRMAKSIRTNDEHINRLGNTALLAGGAITAGLGLGVKAFADFDEAMSSVNAALPEAGAQMEKLRELAIDLGKDSQFSSTQAAQGITELGKAGVSAEAILGGGLKGSLDLAAAGSLEVAAAAEIAASAMTQFGLEGSEVPRIADLLAAGAGKAQGSVSDLGQALNQAGLVANATGLTIEETTAGLAAFASAGLVGSDAGTSFKSMLQRLTPQSTEAAEQFDALGISAYDTQGNFIGLSEFAGDLQAAMKDLTPEARNAALSVMFGSDAVRAANVLYEQGAEGISKWEGAVNDAGFAARQAAALTDNLKGDIERLGGALDAVFVQNGEGANNALRTLTQNAEGAVEAFGAMPQGLQQAALGVAGFTGAGLLAVGVLSKVATSGADLIESMDVLRDKSPRAAKGIDMATKSAKALGVAMAAIVVADTLIQLDELSLGVEGFTSELTKADDVVAAIDKRFAEAAIFDDGTDLGIKSLGDALNATFDPSVANRAENVVGAVRSLWTDDNLSKMGVAATRFEDIDTQLAALVSSGHADEAARQFEQVAEYAATFGVSTDELNSVLPKNAEALAAVGNEATLAGDSASAMAGELDEIKSSAEQADDAVGGLVEAIRGFGDLALTADEAQAQLAQSVDDFTETVRANAEAVKEGEKSKEQATRDNEAALRDIAGAASEAVAANLELTGSQTDARAEMETARAEFIKSAGQLGITGDAAEDLADRYGLIPSEVTTTVKANGLQSTRDKIQSLITAVDLLNRTDATIGVRYVVTGRPNGGRSILGGIVADADGGMHVQSSAGLVKAYAQGGVHTVGQAQPQIARAGGNGILWAEEGAGPWEAFISGHPAKRVRSRSIAADTVERLGGRVEWRRFADGGMFGSGATGPVSRQTTHNQPVIVQRMQVANYDDFRAQEQEERALHNIGGGL
jgi:TP901 family phage tail tape measure protein